MDLKKKLWEMGLIGFSGSPSVLVGEKFGFKSCGDEIFGTITGIGTSDDGFPKIEVSNIHFAGLEIKNLLLTSNLVENKMYAVLFTTATEPSYHQIEGQVILFG